MEKIYDAGGIVMSRIIMSQKKKCRRTDCVPYRVHRSYDPYNIKIQKMISGLLILIITLMFNIIVNCNFAKAEDNSVNTDPSDNKCFKSVVLEYGDTLWGIAAEYKGDYYECSQDYIDEVRSINHLTTDKIYAGQYLTVPYYETYDCHSEGYCVTNAENKE